MFVKLDHFAKLGWTHLKQHRKPPPSKDVCKTVWLHLLQLQIPIAKAPPSLLPSPLLLGHPYYSLVPHSIVGKPLPELHLMMIGGVGWLFFEWKIGKGMKLFFETYTNILFGKLVFKYNFIFLSKHFGPSLRNTKKGRNKKNHTAKTAPSSCFKRNL